ncbi:MAG: site-specific integrase [Rhizomicrobium sp.]|nr:site-specific integrase [Rhizomicrobium sp.]
MARTIRDPALDTRTARARLRASGKPYFKAIDTGLHIGYRKGQTGGKWVLRFYREDGKYTVETIGTADDVIDADGATILNFFQAQASARQLFIERRRAVAGLPTETGPYTVKACIDDYVAWLAENRKSASDARYRADAHVLPDLGKIECAKLTVARLEKWIRDMAAEAPRLRTKAGDDQKHRPSSDSDKEGVRRRKATVNRTLTVLKAALNRAWAGGKIASDDAWRRVKPFREADAARIRYLTVGDCQRLINASAPDFRKLVQAALATGARYGELCALNVEDFNTDSGTLHIRTSKSGKGRHIVLNDEGVALFASLSVGRETGAPMLTKADGTRWHTAHQARPMVAACKAARIKPPASFHCLRHTYASLSIMNGCPLMVVAKNLGHADTRMVERHYGHLAPSFIADAIRAAAPKFGITVGTTVTPMRA